MPKQVLLIMACSLVLSTRYKNEQFPPQQPPPGATHSRKPGLMRRTLPVWIPEFILLAAIWGSSFLFMKIGARQWGALPTAGLRVAIGALCLLPFMLLKGHAAAFRRHWKITFFVGVLNAAIPFALFTYALLTISTGLSAILNATVPMFGALIAWLWLKDRPSNLRILGLILGFAGVAMLAWDRVSLGAAGTGHGEVVAILACLFACTCYGLAASITKRTMQGVPSLVSATGSLIGAALFLLPLTVHYWPGETPGAPAWIAILVLGAVCSGLAYVLYFRLIEKAGPSKALSVTFAIPVFAVFYGTLFLGEAVTLWMFFCAAVIVLGVSLSTGIVQKRA